MLKWLLIMMGVGAYLGMWILTTWLLQRWDTTEDLEIDVVCGMVWPLVLGLLVILSPLILVAYIVKHMPK